VSAAAPACSAEDLQHYLHARIPLCVAMGVRVRSVSACRVELQAPLAPNINHRETVFGGSAAALATLAAWGLLFVRMRPLEPQARLVIQRNTMSYEEPITGDFSAVSCAPAEPAWTRFVSTLRRHGRARIALTATLFQADRRVALFEGDFAAISGATPRP
jgi:thioesterase domain-containing protein